MAANIGYLTQSNGTKLPLIGYGTWLSTDVDQLKTGLRAAFDAGYRYVDTAALYQNEHIIGEVLQEYYDAGKFKREDIFITTKLPFYGHKEKLAEKFIKESLEKLKTDYIDLYLIHTPIPMKGTDDGKAETDENGKYIPELIPHIETWRLLEKYYKKGTFKSIGISNFNSKQVKELYNQAEIKPHNLQIELHILHPQNELVELCKQLNITVTSYGTLGSPGSFEIRGKVAGDCLNHPLVKEMADKYKKSTGQILLRQMIQRGNINVIPKSLNPGRIRQNIEILDFEFSTEDLQKFADLKDQYWLFHFEFAAHHPWYPFHDKVKAQAAVSEAMVKNTKQV